MSEQDAVTRPQDVSHKTPWWLYLALYFLSVLFLAFAAGLVPGPLDVDGAYYLLLARSLAHGRGFVVDGIWRYFQPAMGFPQPGGDLWMPLPSLLMAPGMLLGPTFRHAQIAQVALAALLPLLAFRIARDQGTALAWSGLAALFTLFAGTATVHWVDTDCYTAYAVVGGAALYAIGRGPGDARWLVAGGFLGGLAAITRNDGVLLLVVLWISGLLYCRRNRQPLPRRALLLGTALFLLPPGLWAIRNLVVFGHVTPASLSFFLTMREYSDLFAYRPQSDWAAFWQQGPGVLLSQRASAVFASVIGLLGNLQIWGLVPLVALVFRLRKRPELWPGFLYFCLLFLLLNGAVPLLVVHGSWIRSLSAFLPTVYAGIAIALSRGVERLLPWRRSWPARVGHLSLGLAAALLTVALGMSALLIQLQNAQGYPQTWQGIGSWLRRNTAPDEVVMARDPMAVVLYGERRAVGIPRENLSVLLDVARRYDVRKIVVDRDSNLPPALLDLFDRGTSQGPFTLLWRQSQVQIYALDLQPSLR
jgi:hypothetical protein